MADLIQTPQTMTSLEIAELTSKAHRNVMRDIRTMLVELYGEGGVLSFEHTHTNPQNGQEYAIFRLPRRECLILVSGYSIDLRAKIIDRWEQLERGIVPQRPMTTAEQFLAMAQITVGLERQQKENTQAIAVLTERIDAGMTVLKSRPANAESITHLRERIGDMFGLSASIINQAMQAPDAPRPAGMVQNNHADAEGSQYAVFWKRDVTRFFERFVKDCRKATPFMSTHPYIEGRFRTPTKSENV